MVPRRRIDNVIQLLSVFFGQSILETIFQIDSLVGDHDYSIAFIHDFLNFGKSKITINRSILTPIEHPGDHLVILNKRNYFIPECDLFRSPGSTHTDEDIFHGWIL